MANSFEIESNSASWNQQSMRAEHDDPSVSLQVAQATSGSQPAGQENQPAGAASEPKPVDVGATPAPTPAQAAATPPSSSGEYIVGADKTVHLPANTSIDNIRVEGTNLVLQQADGSVVVIKDGAVDVPTFIVGEVEFPRVALLAALQTSGVDVAFGADGSISAGQGAASNPSAGGNFEHPAGGIGDGFDLSSLLPPTDLQFGQLDERELYPAAPNRDPLFADFSALALSDEGLAGGNPDNDGSNDTTNATLITGRFPATDPDGDALTYTFGQPSGLTSGGVPLVWTGQGTAQLIGSVNGVPVITITAAGDSYTIQLLGPIDHPNDTRPGSEDDLTFTVPVTATDGKGGSTTANMSVTIEDDSPAFVGAGQSVLRVDEDGLASANADSGRSGENDFGKQTVSHIELSTVINPGADGLGSYHFVSGALTQLAGLGLSSNGAAISYVVSPDGHTITGSAGGVSVFTVELTATGSLTFTLLGQVDHVNSPGNVETNLSIDLSGLIEVSDKDGDTLTPPVGSVVVSVGDDIPVAALVLREGASILVDESLGQNGGPETEPAGTLGRVVVPGASLFNTAGSSVGSDSAGATKTFSLEIAAGGHTGLFLTGQSGAANEILLVDNGGVIEGRVGGAGGTLAFTVSIDAATGNVVLTQYESLNHPTPGASYDEALFLATGALKAVYTVTDGDKDIASAAVDLGGQRGVIAFEDDGPTAVLALAGKASIVVDESLGQNGAPETEPVGTLGQVTVLGTSLFDTTGSLAGQDEEGATTAFSLEVAAGGHTGLFLTGQSGAANEILLVDNGGVIEGRVGGAGGTLAFTVSIDPSSGNVTLTQYESLNHPTSGASYDEALFLATGILKAVYTVTDGDNDVASASVDLGGRAGVIAFEDDGPTAVLALAGKASIVVDESLGQNGAPETEPVGTLGQVTVLGTSLFDTTGSLAGQDEEGATTAFSLEVAAGGHTGLFLTGQSGAANEILLVDNGGVIEGRVGGAGGTLAFTVSIDPSTGNVTLTQYESLNHPTPGASYDEALFLASGILKAVYTVTDGDQDVATASVDLGGAAGVIAFEDDGPTAVLALAGKASIVVDESLGQNAGEDETSSLGQVTVLGTSLFDTTGSSVGQDNEGATTAFSLEIAAGGHTGLFLTGQSGAANEILLVDNGGVIEGRVGGAGGTLAFTVSIDAATGNVVLTQYESLNHPTPGASYDEALFLASGILKAVYTVTDGDQDVATASVDLGGAAGVIAFEDDGPTAMLALAGKASIVVDESLGQNGAPETEPVGTLGQVTVLGTSLFDTTGSSAGQDEEGATTAFSLEIAAGGHTGLFLTGQSGAANEILLVDNGGVIEGRVGGAGGTLAFTVSIDAATGNVTLTQFESLNHPTPGASYDEALFLATGILKAVYTVTDGDQDVASASVDLGGRAGVIAFEDDGPTAALALKAGASIIVDETLGQNAGEAEGGAAGLGQVTVLGTSLFDTTGSSAGQDEEGATTAFSLEIAGGGQTGLYLSGAVHDAAHEIVLVDNGGVIEGRVGGAGGVLAFTVSINATNGNVTLTQLQALDHPDTTNADEALYLSSNVLKAVYTVTDGDHDVSTAKVDLGGRAGVIAFEDDAPTAVVGGAGIQATVAEDTMATADGDASNGIPDAGQTSSSDEASGTLGSLGALFNAGADAPLTFSLNPSTSGLPVLYSHGIQLVYNVAGGVLTATAGANTVFTLTVNADGSWNFDLKDQLDHVAGSGDAGTLLRTTVGSVPSIDFSSMIVATDADGDKATGAAPGSFTVTVQNDVPVVVALPPQTGTETTSYSLTGVQAGHDLYKVLNGANDKDILLSGRTGTTQDAVNTSNDIGVGNGQNINGKDNNSAEEYLVLDFVKNGVATGNNMSTTFTATEHYSVASLTFKVSQTTGPGTASVFLRAFSVPTTEDNNSGSANFTDNARVAITTVSVNGTNWPVTVVYAADGVTPIGYLIQGVNAGDSIKVTGAADFGRLEISNYDGVAINTGGGGSATISGAKSFGVLISGSESTVIQPFEVRHDESPLVNNTADPNIADDTAAPLPSSLATRIGGLALTELGHAVSSGTVAGFFTSQPGADEPTAITYQLANGTANTPFTGQDSGLTTTDGGIAIKLFTDPSDPRILWGIAGNDFASGQKVFAAYVDDAGKLWLVQFQAIHNPVAGSTAADYDDAVSVIGNIHVQANVTDADGDVASAVSGTPIRLTFQDDGPHAINDIDTVLGADMTATGNVLTGIDIAAGDANTDDGVADKLGTDGGKVASVAGVSTDSSPDAAHNFQVIGNYGSLVLNEDGSYVYTRFNSDPVVSQDIFTYTIKDGDGDISTATLTIGVADNGTLITNLTPAAGGGDATLSEANLSDGSSSNPAALVQTGSFNVFAPDGIQSVQIGGTVLTIAQLGAASSASPIAISGNPAYGSLEIIGFDSGSGQITYRFTLTDNTLTHTNITADATPGDRGTDDPVFANYTVTVTDTDNDSSSGTLAIRVLDDGPTAHADADAGIEGALIGGNVLTGIGTTGGVSGADVFGADGPTVAGGGVTGVATGSNTASPVTGNVGTPIVTALGTLTLNGDGSYTYQAKPNVVPAGGATDTFVYTITDGDGDTSTVTLTINLSDSGITASDNDAIVNEAGLSTGSDASSNSEIFATGQITASSAVPIVSYAITSVGGGTGSYGTLSLNPTTGAYTYTLTSRFDTSPDADNATNTEQNRDVFTYTATDANGNTVTGTIEVDIIDDVPTAHADADAGIEGALIGGNVLTGIGTTGGVSGADVFGADGPTVAGGGVTGVATGSNTASPVTGNVGTPIVTALGTLTLNGDGSYTYQAKPNVVPAGGATDTFVYTITDGDGDTSTVTLTINLSDSGITASDNDAIVNEAGLSTGSDASSNSEIFATGQITASSAVPIVSYAITSVGGGTGSYGTLSLNPTTGAYTYTLTSRFDTSPDADNATNTEQNRDVFTYTATDANGNTVTGTIEVDIIDDVPTAHADADAGIEGALIGGNVLTGIGTTGGVSGADVFGADGPTVAGGGVTGVATGSNTASPVTGNVGTPIVTALGTLTLNGDGSYTYQAKPNVVPAGGATDTFVYTITDGDGDTSTVTLTINLSDSGITASDNDAIVNEAGLSTGSDASSNSEIFATGQITASSAVPIVSYAITSVGGGTGSYGTLSLNPTTGAYTYTLTSRFDTSPDADNATNTEQNRDVFTYTATDANGNTVTGTIEVDIIDDVPTAHADADAGIEGALIGGNVLTGIGTTGGVSGADVFGADGPTVAGGGVTGVATGSNTASPVTGNVGTPIVTALGTLTLNGDGSYTYQAKPNVVPAGGATDTFVYTITDGDGDTSTVTLTINLSDSGITASDNDAIVNEAGLSTGSDASSNSEIFATGQITASSAVPIVSYAITSVGGGTGSYGTLSLNPTTGAYTYTLTSRFDTSPDADNATNTEQNRDVFTYTATDANGNTVTGTIEVDIIDDVPTAHADADAGIEGALIGGNVLTGIGTTGGVSGADVFGADGPTVAGGGVTGVATGSNTASPVTGNVGTPIVTALGTLTLNGDGSYTYQAKPNVVPAGGATDTFVYTITDGDGDTSTVTLTINLSDSGITASDNDAIVNEAGLSTGSDASSNSEIFATGQITASSAVPIVSYAITSVGGGTGSYGTLSLNPTTGAYTYTLTSRFDTSPDADNATNTEQNRDVFTYTATDANGNTVTGTIEVDIIDDVPTAHADADAGIEGALIGGNVLTGIGTTGGVSGADVFGADGPTVAGGGVTGVATGSNTASPVTGNVGTPIVTALGTLTLNGDGSYTYQAKPNVVPAGGATDTFVYTITDGDGDTSTVTLTINLSDSGITASDNDAIVNEAGLSTGSDASSNSEIFATGQITASSAVPIVSYAITSVGGGTGSYGTLSLNPTTGAYTYTLTSRFDTSPDADNATNTEQNRDVFTYTATDANGNTVTGTIEVDIIDDVPTAHADADAGIEGALIGGNVLTGIGTTGGVSGADVFGADGPTVAGGGVTGVATGSNTASPVTGNVGTPIVTALGTLTLNGDGSYTYQAKPNVVPAGGATDTFVYTITDGDGDTSTVTLTINLSDSGITASDNDAIVNEAGLSTGSDASSNSEIFATGQITASSAVPIVSYAITSVGGGTGSYGTLSLNPTTGAYTYTLTSRFDTSPDADNATNTEQNRDVFTYTATDANGNTVTGTIEVDIIDDVPTARAGAAMNVLETDGQTNGTSLLANDTQGADGATLTHVNLGSGFVAITTGTSLGGGVYSFSVSGIGVYTFKADGTWTFDPAVNASTSNQSGSFTYRITDGDGDTSEAAQVITIANVNNVPTGGSVTASVDDEGLLHGLVGGTGDDTTTASAFATGTLTGSGGDGALSYSFANLAGTPAVTIGQEQVTYSWDSTLNRLVATISSSTIAARVGHVLFTVDVTPSTGAYQVSLINAVLHANANNAEAGDLQLALQYKVSDSDADTSAGDTGTGTLTINFDDDSPVNFTAQAMTIENGANAIGSGALNFYESIGADGGSAVFSGTNGSTLMSGASAVTSGGKTVHLYGFGTDTLTARIDLDGNGTDETTVFTVKLSPNAKSEPSDVYTVQFSRALDDGSGTTITTSNLSSTSKRDYKMVDDTSANDQDILISASHSNGTQGAVNGSTSSGSVAFGVDQPVVSPGDLLRFDFAKGVTVTNSANNSYTDGVHYTTNGFSFTVEGTAGSSVLVVAYDANDNTSNNYTDLTNDAGSKDTITQIYKNGVLLNLASLSASGGGYIVPSVTGDIISVYTADGYNRIEVSNASSNSSTFQISNVGYLHLDTGNPLNLTFNIQATDADGDTSTGSIALTTTPPTNTINGTAGHDTLVAGVGTDTLNGLGGDDTLIGGVGADVLVGGAHSTLGDTASYQNSAAGVTVDLTLVGVAQTSAGDASGDKLTGIENLIGSNFNDLLTGDGNANVLYGLDSNDTLHGGGGDDMLYGGAGLNHLYGEGGKDTFVIDQSALSEVGMVDVIHDYSNADGDVVDLSELLNVALGTNVGTAGYVDYDNASGALKVDVDGGGNNYVTVATLNPGLTTVNILYSEDNHDKTGTAT